MKHTIVLILMILSGTTLAIAQPFFGILPYYILAIVRPQSLWDWTLPDGVRWSLYAAMGAVLGVALSLPRVLTRMHWNRVATLMACFAVLILVSCLNAQYSSVAGDWTREYFKIFVMAAVATVVIESVQHLRWMGMTIALSIGYLAWEFNSRYLFDGRLDIFTYGHGGLDNNGAGLLIATGIPFAFWLLHTSARWSVRIAAGLLGLCMIHAVMLSYSRGAMVAAIVGLIWLALHHRPRWHVAAAALPLALAVIFMAGPEIQREFLSIKSYHSDPSAISRFESWSAAWRIAWDHPLTGAGVRNGNLLSQAYGADIFGRTIHNQYLQIAADSGIPAALCYIALCLAALWSTRRTRRRLIDHAHLLDNEPPLPTAPPDRQPRTSHAAAMRRTASLALAVEAGIIVFLFGGMFLSLETFELAWLLIVLAGVMPGVAQQQFQVAILGEPEPDARPAHLPTPSLLRSSPLAPSLRLTPTPPGASLPRPPVV